MAQPSLVWLALFLWPLFHLCLAMSCWLCCYFVHWCFSVACFASSARYMFMNVFDECCFPIVVSSVKLLKLEEIWMKRKLAMPLMMEIKKYGHFVSFFPLLCSYLYENLFVRFLFTIFFGTWLLPMACCWSFEKVWWNHLAWKNLSCRLGKTANYDKFLITCHLKNPIWWLLDKAWLWR